MTAKVESVGADPEFASGIYFGRVMHARLRPFRHRFVYRVFSLYVDLDELPTLDRKLHLFSYNRRNVLSLHDRDLGPRTGEAPRPWVDRELAKAGIDLGGGRVRLLCFPRFLGYVFNPLAIWFCYDSDERLKAVLCDVSNTFGQSHGYLLLVAADRATGAVVDQRTPKRFYVSPFMDMDARYHFLLAEPGDRLALRIDLEDGEGPGFIATHVGRRARMRNSILLKACLTHPLMTQKVIGGIHWEALRLWRKGARLRPRPAPPSSGVTVVNSPTS